MNIIVTPGAIARFLEKTEKRDDGCWHFMGSKNLGGYGVLTYKKLHCLAHRFSCVMHNIPMQSWHMVHQTCFNRACVNPKHLQLMTKIELNRFWASRAPEKNMVRVRNRVWVDGKRTRYSVWVSKKEAARMAAAHKAKQKKHVCQACGKLISYFFTRKKYCSKPCKDTAYAHRRKEPSPCKRCGKTIAFEPQKSFKAKFCSPQCRHLAQGEHLMFVNPFRRKHLMQKIAQDTAAAGHQP